MPTEEIDIPMGWKVMGKLAKALGCKSKYIKAIHIDFLPNDHITAKVEFFIDEAQVDAICDSLSNDVRHRAPRTHPCNPLADLPDNRLPIAYPRIKQTLRKPKGFAWG